MSTPTPVPTLSIPVLESRISALESAAKADVGKAEGWFAKNWPHLLTWLGVAYNVVRHL